MKFWQKIFFGALIIFVIVFNIAGTVLLQNYHKNDVKRETERGLNEQFSMGTALTANIKYVAFKMGGMGNVSEEVLTKTIEDYSVYYGLNNVFIQVYDPFNNQIFNNFPEAMTGERQELDNIPIDRRQYIIRDIGESTYLFVSGYIQIENTQLIFIYIRNISKVYTSFHQHILLFIWLSLAASIITAFAMLMLSLWLTKSVKRLNVSTEIISNGNFSERVKISSKDELGELSVNFNKMADIIEEKISELEKTADEREQFIHSLTHELKTPLTSMIGYANLLRTTDCSDDQREKALAYLYESSKRLENLSFKLMDMIYLKRKVKEFSRYDIEDIVKSTVMAVQSDLALKHITLQTDYVAGRLLCDKDLIVTMLINLIDNAAKASCEGQTIILRAVDENGGLVFSVTDSGTGIAEEEIDKIMQPFYSGIRLKKGSSAGMGFGLALCRLIATLHGTALQFKSIKGEGTKVSVWFRYN